MTSRALYYRKFNLTEMLVKLTVKTAKAFAFNAMTPLYLVKCVAFQVGTEKLISSILE